jgi:hypothetical protein
MNNVYVTGVAIHVFQTLCYTAYVFGLDVYLLRILICCWQG